MLRSARLESHEPATGPKVAVVSIAAVSIPVVGMPERMP